MRQLIKITSIIAICFYSNYEDLVAQSKSDSNWSKYQGQMIWDDAKANCNSQGMRLPTIDELKFAYNKKNTKAWERDGAYNEVYWSSTPSLKGNFFYALSIATGDVFIPHRINTKVVFRCIR